MASASEDMSHVNNEKKTLEEKVNELSVLLKQLAKANGEPATVCKYDGKCTRTDCKFSHPNGRKETVSTHPIVCKFGENCTRSDCHFSHPDGKKKTVKPTVMCKFGKKCKFLAEGKCTFKHS
jgi:hypothetical protein